jgi:hypothetical protein
MASCPYLSQHLETTLFFSVAMIPSIRPPSLLATCQARSFCRCIPFLTTVFAKHRHPLICTARSFLHPDCLTGTGDGRALSPGAWASLADSALCKQSLGFLNLDFSLLELNWANGNLRACPSISYKSRSLLHLFCVGDGHLPTQVDASPVSAWGCPIDISHHVQALSVHGAGAQRAVSVDVQRKNRHFELSFSTSEFGDDLPRQVDIGF